MTWKRGFRTKTDAQAALRKALTATVAASAEEAA
jgi:hypothetical protein